MPVELAKEGGWTREKPPTSVNVIKSRSTSSLSLVIDVWEDRFGSKKFLGLRVRWIDDMWEANSRLLASSAELRDRNQVSALLSLWVKSCLDECNLSTGDFVAP